MLTPDMLGFAAVTVLSASTAAFSLWMMKKNPLREARSYEAKVMWWMEAAVYPGLAIGVWAPCAVTYLDLLL